MTLNKIFENQDMHFILFGGKGGVGKTSCAASAAIWAAEHLNKKVLVISTDPAHSLGDSIGQSLQSGEVIKVNNVDNLWALEINPELEQSQLSGALSMLPSNDLPLGDDLKGLTNLNAPGIDEAMAFGKVLEYLDDSDYELVIFDTAPTGHTLRLLELPEMLSGWIGKIMMLRHKLGKFFGALKNAISNKGNDNDEEDMFEAINKLKESVERAKVTLMDPNKTSFVIVTIAEAMSIYETERLISSLLDFEIPSTNIIINQLYPEHIDCEFCIMRRKMQQTHVTEIKDLYGDEFTLTEVSLFNEEVRKLGKLRKFGEILFD